MSTCLIAGVSAPMRALSRLAPAGAMLLVWLVFIDHLRRSDLMVFLRAADAVAAGVNPYTPHTDSFLWGGSAYVYPYLTAYLFVPLTHLPLEVADVLWFVLSSLALLGGARVLGLKDPVAHAALLLCAATIRSTQVGALNPVLFLAAAVMWRYRNRTAVVAASFTFLVGTKLFLAPLALWLVLSRPRRTWIAALLCAATYLGAGFLLGPISMREYLSETRALAEHERLQGMSLARLAHDLLPGAEHWMPVGLSVWLLLLILQRTGGLRRFAAGEALRLQEERFAFVGSLLIALALTPIFWSHYIVLGLLIPLVLWPTTSTALSLLPLSWLLSRPDKTSAAFSLPGTWRSLLLFGLLTATVVATRRPAPGLQRSLADRQVDATSAHV